MIIIIDNYDSFTYNLADYFARLGTPCRIIRNDVPIQEWEKTPFQGLVLSPGPGTPDRAGLLMSIIERFYLRYPILGVCLGHQALATFFGAKLRPAHRPMHGKLSMIDIRKPNRIFDGFPNKIQVVRYHSWVVDALPNCLQATAFTHDMYAELMAFEHCHLPIFGLQFHPEAILTQAGIQMLDNWLKYTGVAYTPDYTT